jgi:uncharacterized protein
MQIENTVQLVHRRAAHSQRSAPIAQSSGPPRTHPQLFLIMKATRLCNLRCGYCNAWKEGPNQIMPETLVERATKDALQLPWIKRVDFVWHGGETTLLPVAYFRTAINLQKKYQQKRLVTNTIQTNATLLDGEWISLFKEGNFNVGVSIDPPPERHARNRRTKGGRDSWQASMAGIRLLEEAGISHGILVVVNDELVTYGAERFLACLDENKLHAVSLLNVLPDNREVTKDASNYLGWERFIRFLIAVYQIRASGYKHIRIREFESLVGSISRGAPTNCVFAGNCMGQFLTLEPSGEVSACDKYINDSAYVFGNLVTSSLTEILSAAALSSVREEYSQNVAQLASCRYYGYCNGGCPHDQYLRRKADPQLSLRCCGLAPLIETICQDLHHKPGA